MTRQLLKEGTIVHVCGFPLELAGDVEVITFDGNWGFIQEALTRPAPSWPEGPSTLTPLVTTTLIPPQAT